MPEHLVRRDVDRESAAEAPASGMNISIAISIAKYIVSFRNIVIVDLDNFSWHARSIYNDGRPAQNPI